MSSQGETITKATRGVVSTVPEGLMQDLGGVTAQLP
jgi:hypothetical protein